MAAIRTFFLFLIVGLLGACGLFPQQTGQLPTAPASDQPAKTAYQGPITWTVDPGMQKGASDQAIRWRSEPVHGSSFKFQTATDYQNFILEGWQ